VSGYLLVESGARTFGLPGHAVSEIIQVERLLPAPAARPAVRGVLSVRDRLVPLVHLAAALDDETPPETISATAVLVTGGGRLVALEVDATADFVPEDPDPVPSAWEVPWAAGVVRRGGRLVPVVDLDVLIERLRTVRTGARS